MVTNKQAGGVAAVVLAAGMSRRMSGGVPKQLLRTEGKTLLERALENVQTSRVNETVLVLGAGAGEIKQNLTTTGIQVVVNPEYQQGMGTSLRAGLAVLGSSVEAALIVLADQPFVRGETIDKLIAHRRESGAQIAIPLYRGFRGNPVLLDRSVFPELMNLSGDVGCRAIFGNHTQNIIKVEVDDPGILLDIDTEEDLRRLEPLLGEGDTRGLQLPELEQHSFDQIAGPDLVIVGRDEVARALGQLARVLHLNVTFVDPLLKLADLPEADRVLHVLKFSLLPAAERFVVVASRGQCDEEALEQALASEARYVALLANRRRSDEVLHSLKARGISSEKVSAVRSPAGLEIGAQTPEEIALSILAEIVASRRKKQPGLRAHSS